jgi:hypothetical protein
VLTVPPQWLCTVLLAIIGLWAGAPPVVVLACFLVFSFFNAMYNTLTSVYPGEVFPTEVCELGTGFADTFSRVGAGLATFLLPLSMENLGSGPTILIAAGVAGAGSRDEGDEPQRDIRRVGARARVCALEPDDVGWPCRRRLGKSIHVSYEAAAVIQVGPGREIASASAGST